MKYKLYERALDFFRMRIFSKTNIAIVAVLSVVLNVAMAGITYKEHKELVSMSALYAVGEVAVEETTAASLTTSGLVETTVPAADESEETTEPGTTGKVTEAQTSSAESNVEQGTYYVTNSGTKYHRANCSYLSKSRHAISLTDAKAGGYQPCSRCIK